MSRLDRHVAMVQNKLALGRFIQAIGWASLIYVAVIWVGILMDRLFGLRLPHTPIWVWSAAGAGVLAALVYAIVRRPSAHDAALAIDERLALKEKFSTALYARSMKDAFADAAVKDAERTAENVSLSRRFPLEFPSQGLGTIGVLILVALTSAMKPLDLFGREASRIAQTEEVKKADEARKQVEKALQVIVDAQAKGAADDETIKQAKIDLQKMLQAPIKDPEKIKRSAARALSDVDQAIKQQIGNNQKFADAENDAKAFKSLMPPTDDKGPVADAQRKIAQGKFADAVDDLEKSVDKFDKMSEDDKKKAADQMQNMAKQLQQMANNPQAQQQAQQQMQQAGMNQQQAQQAAQLMQQAAQGDKQAQQQLQQMGQQAMKQMNNGQGPNPQQQQQIQNMMKQMQAQANTQAQAQQMAQAAQQMAAAMKQQAQAGQQGQQGQQPGQQPGQQGQQQAAQQMQQGQAAMKQQLGAMQAMKADAQQVAAAQAAAAQGAADAAAGLNNGGPNPGQQQGQGNWQGGNPGGNNNNQGKWNGQPNPNGKGGGQGAGPRDGKEEAPYAVKQEISQSQDIEGGKILASSLIKASSNKGESKVGTQSVNAPPEQDATDEVEQERISRPAQEAVKNYFSAWQKDAAADGAGAPAAK